MKICSKGLHMYIPYKDNKRAGCWECRKLYVNDFLPKWRKENRSKCNKANKKWRENNREYNKKRLSEYQKKNADKYAFSTSMRRKIVKKQTPKWLSESDLIEIKWAYKIASDMTKETGIKYEVDHIIPLKGKNISGLHCPQNLQIITEFDNISKHNKFNERNL